MRHLYRMRPFPKRVIWAGHHLSRIVDGSEAERRPGHRVGETMEVGALPGMESVAVDVDGRAYALDYLWKEHAELLGGPQAGAEGPFPILVKRLDAGQTLSLQVHPNDADARRLEGAPNGKSEAWVILAAEEGAGVWLGLADGESLPSFRDALSSGDPMKTVRFLGLKRGDAVPVPAGCVHAISGGLLIFEVQQPSDHTYRLHDFGRVDQDGEPRRLDIEKALQVLDPASRPEISTPQDQGSTGEFDRSLLVELPTFTIERWSGAAAGQGRQVIEGLTVLHVVAGAGWVRVGEEALPLSPGSTHLVAAAAESVQLEVDDAAALEVLVATPC